MLNIKNNKRILYLTFCLVLILLYLILNISFSYFQKNINKNVSNIKIGDLSYKMFINEQNNSDENYGKKDIKTNVVGDRILKILPSKKEYFTIELTSLNNIDTKYEVIYNICTDINCTDFINDKNIINKINVFKTKDNISGNINTNETKSITIATKNYTEDVHYILVDLNVGYSHNELILKNKINLYTKDYVISNVGVRSGFESVKILTTITDDDGNIITDESGDEYRDFPLDDDYDTSVFCHVNESDEESGTGELTYVYDEKNITGRWKLKIQDITSISTVCNVNFKIGKTPVSFKDDSWSTIAHNIDSTQYNVGDTKCVTIDGIKSTNNNGCSNGEFLVRLVNKSTPLECDQSLSNSISESACGFVVEFVDLFNYDAKSLYSFAPSHGFNKTYAKDLESKVYQKLPTLLKENIPCTNVFSDPYNNYALGDFIKVSAKLYTFDMREYLLDTANSYPHRSAYTRERQLDYYEGLIANNDNSKLVKMYNNVATRYYSRTMHSDGWFYGISKTGKSTSGINYSSEVDKMALGFRISSNNGSTKDTCYP